MSDAFYHRDGDAFAATALTMGPWNERFQHGGPPSALLTGAMERHENASDRYALCRVHIELLRPVPIGVLRLRVAMTKVGRTTQRLHGELLAGDRVVLEARALRILRRPLDVGPPGLPEPWPAAEAVEPFEFPFFQHEVGYHRAVDLRIVQGSWGTTPIGVWARSLVPLVAGETTGAAERTMILADAQSGMGPPCSPGAYTFVNPDLGVYFERMPRGEWLGFDIRSTANAEGAGLSQSGIRDADGLFARSAQTMVVTKR